MARHVLTDAFVMINAVDLSDHVESVTLTYSAAEQQATSMGDVAQRRLAGLKDVQVEINFRQDYDAAKVEATLYPLLGVETALQIRPNKTSVISSTNPEYQFNGTCFELPLVAGSVGELHNASVSFMVSNGADLVRDVTP